MYRPNPSYSQLFTTCDREYKWIEIDNRIFNSELLYLYGINFKLSNGRKLNTQGITPCAICCCIREDGKICRMMCRKNYYVSGCLISVC